MYKFAKIKNTIYMYQQIYHKQLHKREIKSKEEDKAKEIKSQTHRGEVTV
jgi:hypothetical protein